MRRVGRQAQLVNLLPCSNAHVRWIEVGSLFGQLLASFFDTLRFFVREALGGIFDQVACAGQRHDCERNMSFGSVAWRNQPQHISRKVSRRGTGYTSCPSAAELSSMTSQCVVVGGGHHSLREARTRDGCPRPVRS